MECALRDTIHQIIAPKKQTNTKSLNVFCNLTLTYVATAIYAFIIYNNYATDILNKIIQNLYEISRLLIFVLFFFVMVTTAMFLLIISKISKASIMIGISLKCLLFIISFFTLTNEFIKSYTVRQNPWNLFSICLLCFWSFYVSHFAFSRVGMNLINQVIKESCRAIKECSYVILLTVLSIVMTYIVMCFTLAIFSILMETQPPLSNICILINLIHGLWLTCFIITFTELVCCKTFSTWFFTKDKSTFSKYTTIENIVAVARYHLGTVAYASSLWSMVPLIYHLIKNVVKKERDTRYNIFVLISCYLSTFWTLTYNSCTVTATKGKSYEKSIDAASQLYLKYPLQVHAINKAVTWCIMYASFLIIALYSLIFIGIRGPNGLSVRSNEEIIAAFVISLIVSIMPGILLILTAVVTITFCIFENYEYEKQNKIETNYTNPMLKDLVLKE